MERLFAGIQFVKGVGPERAKLLQKLGIKTVFDLMWLVPRDYFNQGQVENIKQVTDGAVVSIRGKILNTALSSTRNGYQIFKALIEDDSAKIMAVWFNQAYLARQLQSGQELWLSGKVRIGYGSRELNVKDFCIVGSQETSVPILPVYPLTEGLSQKMLRKLIAQTLDHFLAAYPELLDEKIRNRYQLCDIQFAIRNIHFPSNGEAFSRARRRLAFEELFLFKLSLDRDKAKMASDQAAIVHRPHTDLVDRIIARLAFTLTAAQQRVVQEILRDMQALKCMNRLLQGDVGSGKTVVAALALAQAVASGYQAAIMVPTEILADQHYFSLRRIFADTTTVIARLTGATPRGERKVTLAAVASGEIDILVGTHALIQEEVRFHKLGLAVIDEQHRFGVRQRAQLSTKGEMPDMLVMTATPIPRTLALALYGDLNVSIIDELPPGRQAIKTKFIRRTSRREAYDFIGSQIRQGAQAYVVCPLIEESESQDLQAAVNLFAELKSSVYPDFHVGLLHGRMKSSEKEQVMGLFKTGQIDVLVTTTVVEVGVDVSNACLILIEHAERFGLSQLHQLRGRVGRGPNQSYCLLLGEPKTEEALRRLEAMEKTGDGFALANEDLSIRGPGDFWGVKQHGLNELKIADLLKDQQIIGEAGEAVHEYDLQLVPTNLIDAYIAAKFNKSRDIARN